METSPSLRLEYAATEILHRRRFLRDKMSIDLQRDTWVFVAYQLGDFRYRNAVSDKQGTERMPQPCGVKRFACAFSMVSSRILLTCLRLNGLPIALTTTRSRPLGGHLSFHNRNSWCNAADNLNERRPAVLLDLFRILSLAGSLSCIFSLTPNFQASGLSRPTLRRSTRPRESRLGQGT